MRSQVASVVDRQTIHGIGDEENDPHAGLSDFHHVRDNLLNPGHFFSVEPISVPSVHLFLLKSAITDRRRVGVKYVLSDSGRTPEKKRSVESDYE